MGDKSIGPQISFQQVVVAAEAEDAGNGCLRLSKGAPLDAGSPWCSALSVTQVEVINTASAAFHATHGTVSEFDV